LLAEAVVARILLVVAAVAVAVLVVIGLAQGLPAAAQVPSQIYL
jgi:hypothetical protein